MRVRIPRTVGRGVHASDLIGLCDGELAAAVAGGGAVATAILLGVFVLPFLFMKKKNHWMTVQTEKEYAVIKLGDNNFRQVVAEFETHGVKVNTVTEEKEKKSEKAKNAEKE